MSVILGGITPSTTPVRESQGRTDEELVDAARTGGRAAFEELVERFQGLVCSLAYALTGNATQTDEVAQETFIVAWRRLPSLKPPYRFRGWLCGITRNVILGSSRKQRHQSPPGTISLSSRSDIPSVDPSPSPLDRVISNEQERVFWQALGAIPETFRVPLVLFYAEQQSVDKVAEALDLTPDSVRMRLSRGRKLLQKEVDDTLQSVISARRRRKELTVAVMAALSASAAAPAAASTGEAGAAKAAFLWKGAALVATAVASSAYFVAKPLLSDRPASASHISRLATAAGVNRAGALGTLDGSGAAGVTPAAPPNPEGTSGSVLSFDFEDGESPPVLYQGTSAVCPGWPGNHFCALASLGMYAATMVVWLEADVLFTYDDDLVLAFDYWLGSDADPIYVQMFNREQNVNYSRTIRASAREVWAHAEVRLADLTHAGRPPCAGGDRIENVLFLGGRTGGKPFYVDNIRIAHDAKPAHP